jgi:uncharacterized Zn finger protein
MSLPSYTEADIREQASADSFQRGHEYCQRGAVESLIQRGVTLQADVLGSDVEPYRVRVTFESDRLAQATCTCPYDWGGWCKHIVATLLAAREQPKTVEERKPLADLLTGLSRDQLQALLLRLIQFEPDLVDMIEAQVPLLASGAVAAVSASDARSRTARLAVDPKALRRQVRSLLSHGGGGPRAWGGYGYVGAAVSAVSEIVAQARQLLEAGDGRAALTVLDILTEEFISTWEGLDDSDGESRGFFEELGGLWAEALLTDDLPAEERQAWIPRIETWQRELSDYGIDEEFDVALSAAVQGWEHPPLQRVLRGEIGEQGAWESEALPWADALAEAQLNVLDRQGRHQEYLYLAEAEGQTERYVTMLARLGRGAEALDYGRVHLATVSEAYALTMTLWERGESERALESAEHGLTLEGSKGGLASWLRDRAAERGQPERALAAAEVAFEAEQDLATYLRLRELAGPTWVDIQPALLDRLRNVRSYYPRGAVEIFLHEGLIEDAIAAVDQGATHTLVEQVADAAISSHPDWVVKASRKQAESIMNDGKSQYYRAAADWLARARDAYRAAGREREWQTYLADLLDRHRRKYTLVPLLKALK